MSTPQRWHCCTPIRAQSRPHSSMPHAGDTGNPPKHGPDGTRGACHRQPRSSVFRSQAAERPNQGELQHPQEVRVALYPLSRIEHQTMPLEQIPSVPEADEGIVAEKPRHRCQPGEKQEPGQTGREKRSSPRQPGGVNGRRQGPEPFKSRRSCQGLILAYDGSRIELSDTAIRFAARTSEERIRLIPSSNAPLEDEV